MLAHAVGVVRGRGAGIRFRARFGVGGGFFGGAAGPRAWLVAAARVLVGRAGLAVAAGHGEGARRRF